MLHSGYYSNLQESHDSLHRQFILMTSLHVDGATLEGGGQLVRLFILLSSLTNSPVTIKNVRAGRSGGGGLKNQHVASLAWLSKVSNAQVSGAIPKSREVSFTPNEMSSNRLSDEFKPVTLPDGSQVHRTTIAMQTLGSVSLMLQAILPFLLLSPLVPTTPILLTLVGGTNVTMSPSIDYVLHVFSPILTSLLQLPEPLISLAPGYRFKRSFFHSPRNLGEVTLLLRPFPRGSPLPSFDISPDRRGTLTTIKAIILVPSTAACEKVLTNLRVRVESLFPSQPELHVETHDVTPHPKCWYLLLVACMSSGTRLGADWLFDDKFPKAKPTDADAIVADKLVKRVSGDLDRAVRSGAYVDEHCEDQLVVFQALGKGRSTGCGRTRAATLHTETARWAVSKMLGVDFDDCGSCDGVGLVSGKNEGSTEGQKRGEAAEECENLLAPGRNEVDVAAEELEKLDLG